MPITTPLTYTVFLPLVRSGFPDPLTRLENGGYVDLADQLRALPEIADGISALHWEAVEDIANLALNASNPQVGQAFDLMVGSGIGNLLVDYGPPWNSQLRLLFWLALENELKPDDTLAQAVALSNGIWEAMGDSEVDQALGSDISSFLQFQRTANPHVEAYPLDALVALAWRGNYSPTGEGDMSPLYRDFVDRPVDIATYHWNTLSMDTLISMNSYAKQRGWGVDDVGNIEDFFYFGDCPAQVCSERWNFVLMSPLRTNADAVWDQYGQNGQINGDCGIESILVDGISKAIGVPTTLFLRQAADGGEIVNSHMYVLYFNTASNHWTAYSKQLNVDMGLPYTYIATIHKPPVRLESYLTHGWTPDGRIGETHMWYTLGTQMTLGEIRDVFVNGVPSPLMWSWFTED